MRSGSVVQARMRLVMGLTVVAATLLVCGVTLVFVGFAVHLNSPRDGHGLQQAGGAIAICGLAFGVALLAVLAIDRADRPDRDGPGRPAGWHRAGAVPAAGWLSPLPPQGAGPGAPQREAGDVPAGGSGYADDGWHPETGGGSWSPGPAYVWTPGGVDDWGSGDDGWSLGGQPGRGDRGDWGRDGQDAWAAWSDGGQQQWAPAGLGDWAADGQDGWDTGAQAGWDTAGRGGWAGHGQAGWDAVPEREWVPPGQDGWGGGPDDWAPPGRDGWDGGPDHWAPPGRHGRDGGPDQWAPVVEPEWSTPAPGTAAAKPAQAAEPDDAGAADDTTPLPVIRDTDPPPQPGRGTPALAQPSPGQPAPFSVWEPTVKKKSPEPGPGDAGRGAPGQHAKAEPLSADTEYKLEQIKDLYLTAAAIGEDALVRHFDQLSKIQRSLIREFFEKAGLGSGNGPAANDPAAEDQGSKDLGGKEPAGPAASPADAAAVSPPGPRAPATPRPAVPPPPR